MATLNQSFNPNNMSSFHLLVLGLCFSFYYSVSCCCCCSVSSLDHEIETPHRNLVSESTLCPLDFHVLRKAFGTEDLILVDVDAKCQTILQGIRLLRSNYLRRTGHFSPPPNASEVCWDLYQKFVYDIVFWLDIPSTCGFNVSFMSKSCKNIRTARQFEKHVSSSKLQKVRMLCNRSLDDWTACKPCQESLSNIYQSYFNGPDVGNASDCAGYPFIYAAAMANIYGPNDLGTAKCLFKLDLASSTGSSNKKKRITFSGVSAGALAGLLITAMVIWCCWIRKKKRKQNTVAPTQNGGGGEIETISGDSTLVKFTFEELRNATMNFSRENIIGKGGFGNVYKGILEDGSEVALKRFKNCSALGDATFAHEVEVIASIRHVNLVEFRGYCTAAVPMEGHQRILVCELVHNGSLFDHLFGPGKKKLSWPIRQKIALGVARGLEYLHHGAQPAIIHRDIKASNILLDDTFEPKLADFGLAKFTPDGFSHMSTNVAGTLGYVAPEYALYGQVTERTDVYGFGVVLLELLSGKKAVISFDGPRTLLLTDWAWSLVEEGRVLDVVDETMPELGTAEVMEKYVLVAILASHPKLYARPTMDQIVRMLEVDFPISTIQKLSFSLAAEIFDDGERYNNLSYLPTIPSANNSSEQPSDHTIEDHSEVENSS